jgi:hypothetical protein
VIFYLINIVVRVLGLSLLSLALDESVSLNADSSDSTSVSFSRQLYIHALNYLIRALPADLTTEEQISIRSALPQGIVQPVNVDFDGHPIFSNRRIDGMPDDEKSLLHRMLAQSIVQFFLMIHYVVPYIKLFLRAAYKYDREHHISEKVFSGSIQTADTLGRRSIEVGTMIAQIGDGRVGQLLNDVAAWTVEGVAGGIYEGVGEGMVILGAKRPGPERRSGVE